MKLREYARSIKTPLRQATIMLLVKDDEVLLAMKKRGFGAGKWNGTGGKLKQGESILEAAVRETQEEITVTPLGPKRAGVLNFYFPHKPEWNQQVTVYTAVKWAGVPAETEEMKPQWFKIKNIPYSEMWWDDEIWMPRIFKGEKVQASFLFGEKEELVEQQVGVLKVNQKQTQKNEND